MNRKGISPIIAFVMLMALAVTLGTFVTIWYTKSTESQTKTIVEKFGNADECADVRFDVSFDYDNCIVVVYNLGSFTIDKIQVNAFNGEVLSIDEKPDTKDLECINAYTETAVSGLPPKAKCNVPMNSDITKLIIGPIIVKEGTLTLCTNDRIFTPKETFTGCLA